MSIYKNKKFTDLSTGRVVQVTDHFEDIVILDNRSKVKLNNLLDNRLYDEYIDPMNFFRNEGLVNAFTEKIRQLPNDVPQDKGYDSPKQLLNNYGNPYDYIDQTPAVLPYDPEEEKQQLIEKAKRMFNNNNVQNTMDSFKDLIGEDTLEDLDDDVLPPPLPQKTEVNQRPINESLSKPSSPQMNDQILNQQLIQQQSVDPIIQMFRNVKRNTDFNIKFEINNKIPRLDFIEMMEESYNTSIIDFLAEEFTNQILLNPNILKSKIKDQINLMLHKKANSNIVEKVPQTPKTSSRKKIIPKND
jgi:hypothetical protein